MIGKLTNGQLVPCPRQGQDGRGRLHTNLPVYYAHHVAEAAEDGYYPVRYTDKPEGDYLQSWELRTTQSGAEIVQIWTPYTPEPEPEDPYAARLDMIEECILEMSEIVYA